MAIPVVLYVTPDGEASPHHPRVGPEPSTAAWAVAIDNGRGYDRGHFGLVYIRGCGDRAQGLIKHPERVLGLPQG